MPQPFLSWWSTRHAKTWPFGHRPKVTPRGFFCVAVSRLTANAIGYFFRWAGRVRCLAQRALHA